MAGPEEGVPGEEEVEALLWQGQQGAQQLDRLRERLRGINDAQRAIAEASRLARAMSGDGARLLGIAALEDAVRDRRAMLGPEGMARMVEEAVTVLTLLSSLPSSSSFPSKSRAASLLSFVTLSARTHSWSSVLDMLEPESLSDPNRAECLALALKAFSEDAALHKSDASHASPAGFYNPQLQNGGNDNSNHQQHSNGSNPHAHAGTPAGSTGDGREVLSELMSTLPRALASLNAIMSFAFSPTFQQSFAAVRAAVDALSSIAEWAPLGRLQQSGILQTAGQLMLISDFRDVALASLRPVCVRRITQGEEAAGAEVCRALARVTQHLLSNEPDALDAENIIEHEFVCTLSEAVASLMQQQLPAISKTKLHSEEVNELLTACLDLTRAAKLRVAAPLLPAWNHVMRSSMKSALPGSQLAQAVAEWLYAGGGVLSNLRSAQHSGCADAWERELAMSEAGEELFEAWAVARSSLRQMCSALASEIAPEAASAAAGTLYSRAASLWSSCSDQVAPSCALDGAASFADPTFASLPDRVKANPSQELLDGLNALMRLPAPTNEDAALAAELLSAALESGKELFSHHPALAVAGIQRVLAMLSGLPREHDEGKMPARSREGWKGSGKRTVQLARQRACTALVGICAGTRGALSDQLDSLAQEAFSLNLQGAERSALVEALILLAGGSRQHEVAAWAFQDSIARLQQEHNLVEAFNSDNEAASNERWVVFHDVQLVDRAMRRVKQIEATEDEDAGGNSRMVPTNECASLVLSSGLLSTALPAIAALVQQLHAMYMQKISIVREDLRDALGVAPEEREAALTSGPARHAPTLDESPEWLQERRTWARGLRDSLYMAANGLVICAPDEYFVNGLKSSTQAQQISHIATSMCAGAAGMEARHFASLLKSFVTPLYARLPAGGRPLVFQCTLPYVLEALDGLMSTGVPVPTQRGGEQPLPNEMHAEHTWREAVREAQMAFMQVVRHPRDHASSGKSKHKHLERGTWLMDLDLMHARWVLASASASLAVPDSKVVSKALAVCRSVTAASPVRQASNENAGWHLANDLGHRTAFAAVSALRLAGNASHASELVGLVADAMAMSPSSRMAASAIANEAQQSGYTAETVMQAFCQTRGEREQRQALRKILLSDQNAASRLPGLMPPQTNGLVVHSSSQPAGSSGKSNKRKVSEQARTESDRDDDEEEQRMLAQACTEFVFGGASMLQQHSAPG